jgi:hypothetical protein
VKPGKPAKNHLISKFRLSHTSLSAAMQAFRSEDYIIQVLAKIKAGVDFQS